MSAKKYLKIPANDQQQDVAKKEAEAKLFSALKKHILRERESKKKQSEEQNAKEEQLRNERQAHEKEVSLSLGKTQEEIQQVEEQLISLRNKKQNLFLQLKKLLTIEVEMEKKRQEPRPSSYQTYPNEKEAMASTKRSRSPIPVSDYYKHAPSQSVYLSPSKLIAIKSKLPLIHPFNCRNRNWTRSSCLVAQESSNFFLRHASVADALSKLSAYTLDPSLGR